MNLKPHYKKNRFADWRTIFPHLRLYVIVVALFLGGVWSFFWVPALHISRIVTNDPLLENRVVHDALAGVLASKNRLWLPQNNIFLFSSRNAEQALREAGVGIAKIKKHYPNSLLVEFETTEPKFIFCPDTLCYYVNQNGIMSEKAAIFSENPLPLIVVTKNNPILGDQIIEKRTANFLAILQKNIELAGIVPQKIEVVNDTAVTITMGTENNRVQTWLFLVSPTESPEKIGRDLQLLLREKIKDNINKLEYIDMRFPDKAFFKLH